MKITVTFDVDDGLATYLLASLIDAISQPDDMDDDVNELEQWVQWCREQQVQDVN